MMIRRRKMAILIDKLLNNRSSLGHMWYIAKPCSPPLLCRLKDVWGIITGKYVAVKFAVDVYKEKNQKDVKLLSKKDVERAKELASERLKIQLFSDKINKFGDLKVGRNNLCLCKSGKKFKDCCGIED